MLPCQEHRSQAGSDPAGVFLRVRRVRNGMADALDQNFTYLLPGLSIGFSGLSYNKRSMATCIRGQLS